MVAIGYSTLKRNVALAALLAASVSSCASVDHTSQTELSAVQTVVPITKPGTEVGYATADATTTTGIDATGGMVASAAAIDQTATTTTMATATTTSAVTPLASTKTASSTETMKALAAASPVTTTEAASGTVATSADIGTAQTMTDSYAAMPLTDEVTAIQSVIPSKRPGSELAYAATPARTATSMNSLMDFDTRPTSAIETSPSIAASLGDRDDTPTSKGPLRDLISKYARLYEVPEALVHRVVKRESTYNPRAYAHGNYGLMQIRYNTAKAMGYDGPASGLFDAETNLKYAVKYLRGAWITADTNHDGAVKLYSTGYYYTAKRKGLLNQVQ